MCYTITMQRKRGLDIYMKRSNSDMNKFTAAALPLAATAALAAAPIHTAPGAAYRSGTGRIHTSRADTARAMLTQDRIHSHHMQ